MGWRSVADRWERGGPGGGGVEEVGQQGEKLGGRKIKGSYSEYEKHRKKKQENPHVLKNKQTPKKSDEKGE